ncbi:hypothetical protein [Tenacibaculum holothuriorum]|uniref:hypothetical protein n=1 Tax=Tenacibaculum holothuriorum TaxID=1635173 RepID=UPI00117FEB28|nr:hypothetical protein [Tenacibaculum holothuriorum]
MKSIFKITVLCCLSVLFVSCFGDKKTAIGTDFNDTSFVNKSFKNNKVNFSNLNNSCQFVSKNQIAKLYNVTEDKVQIIGNELSKSCTIRVLISDNNFDFLTGAISFYKTPDKLDDGSTWVDSWQLKKGLSKSSVWIKNMGKAALYNAKKRTLFIKFNNYTMELIAPGSDFNQIEKAKKRDYKTIALTLAKNTPLLN